MRPGVPRLSGCIVDDLNQTPHALDKIRSAGARLLFLPKYSPDLNPIQQVFAKLKTLIRKAEPRTFDAVSDALKNALAELAPSEWHQKRRLRVHLNAEGSRRPLQGRYPLSCGVQGHDLVRPLYVATGRNASESGRANHRPE